MASLKRIWEKEHIQLTDLQNACITTTAVIAGLLYAMHTSMGTMTGFFVVSIQNIAGMNTKESFLFRIKSCFMLYLILCASAMLVVLTNHSFPLSVAGLVLLCLSLACWHQLFPGYWASINIPAVVIFFMALSMPGSSPVIPVFAGASIGLLFQMLTWIYLLFSDKNRISDDLNNIEILENENMKPKRERFYLHRESLIYGAQMLVLLSIALLVMRLSGYPHAYWMAFTMVIVLKITHKDTRKFSVQRVLGTVIGCVLGSLLLLLHPQGFLYAMAIALNIFLFTYLIARHYVIGVVFITIFVLLLIGHQTTDPLRISMERIGFTLAGGLLSMISSFLISKILIKD